MATGHELDASWLFGGPRLPRFFSDIYTETEWDPPGLAVSMAANVATLTWSASPTAGVTSYDLYRRTPPTGVPFVPGSDTPVATGVTSPYADSGLASATYEWQVFGVVGAPWDPSSVSPFAWYDFSDSGSVTLSGSNITAVTDQSGNGNTISQGTGGNQPTYTNTVNGLNVGTFGSNKWLNNTSLSVTGSQPYTLFGVFNLTSFANYGMVFGNATQDNTCAGIITHSTQGWGCRAPDAIFEGSAESTGTTYAVMAVIDGLSTTLYVGGSTYAPAFSNPNTLNSQIWVGSVNGGQNDSLYGHACECFAASGDWGTSASDFMAWAGSKWGAV